MKKYTDKAKLVLAYASKNIVFGKIKSVALLMTFSIIVTVTLLILSLKPLISNYFHYEVESKYSNFNLVMTVDENTNARFFSIRKLPTEMINSSAPFFEVNTIMVKDESDYVKVMTGSVDSLRKVNKNVKLNSISSNQVIITQSLANDFSININDEISLQLDNGVLYKVVEIVDDDGLFTDSSVFIDKDSNIHHILNALNLVNIDPAVTKNLYNLVYLDVNNLNVQNDILSIDDYQYLKVSETYNISMLDQNIRKTTAGFLVIFSFVFLSVLFVLQSTLSILFKGRVKEIGVIKSVGGRSSFFLRLIIVEILTYICISIIIGALLTNIIINKGLSFINSSLVYNLDLNTILVGILIVLVIIYFIVILNYFRIRKTSIIAISQDNKIKDTSRHKIYFSLFSALFLVNYLFNKSISFKSTISAVLIIIIGLIASKLLLQLGQLLKKKNLFSLISIKNVNQNKTISNNLNILIISFFSIILMFSSINLNKRYNKQIEEELNIDFIITNIVHDTAGVVDEVSAMENVKSTDEALMFKNIKFENSNHVADYMISIKAGKLLDYFNLDIDEEVIGKLSDKNKTYIVLPENYRYLYNYKVDDKIYLNISEEYSNEEFIIAGFFNNSSHFIILTNMIDANKYSGITKNIIIVNGFENKFILYQELINKYKSNLYYIIDFDVVISNMLDEVNKIINYMNYVSYIIILCFVITIFNNSILVFDEMKSTYAKMMVIGISQKRLYLMVLKENLYLLVISILNVLLMALGFIPNLLYIVLHFHVYYPLVIKSGDLAQSFVVCILVFTVSYIYYFTRLRKINIIDEIKMI